MSQLEGVVNQLRRQHKQAQLEVQKLEAAIDAIEGLVGRGSHATSKRGPKSKLSAAGRSRIAQAQKARWAKGRNQQEKPSAESKSSKRTPAKRTMSPAARRKIAAAQTARWAQLRKQQQKKAAYS
jgi:hypothetical protein